MQIVIKNNNTELNLGKLKLYSNSIHTLVKLYLQRNDQGHPGP